MEHYEFNHIGIATKSIQETTRRLDMLGIISETICDPLQRVNIAFINNLELIEPASKPSPVDKLLANGVSIYHICYEVKNIGHAIYEMCLLGYELISQPKPAVAFDGRLIAFLAHPEDRILIELLGD